ncbi:LysR family transcriptional regulator [Streptomyces chartreusis]
MELRAFVAAVEEGGLSAAARRLHMSQPALSQTISGLERQLGVKLLVRNSTGVRATEAGTALLTEARAVLARHDQALRVMARYVGPGGGALRIGIPLELPAGLLDAALAELAEAHPDTRVQPRHLPPRTSSPPCARVSWTSGSCGSGRSARSSMRCSSYGRTWVSLLATEQAAELAGPDGVALDALVGLRRVGFPRSGSPVWFDELTAILRGHGLDLGPDAPEGQALIADVKLAGVRDGRPSPSPRPAGSSRCPTR